MALGTDYAAQDCALARALELLGERWTLLIVRDAFYGVRRYGDFLTHLDMPRAVLATRLRALVEAGVLDRTPYQPHRYEYTLTERGRQLWPALNALGHWGGEHMSPLGPCRVYRHVGCDARVDHIGVCPACGRYAPPEELVAHPGPGAGTPHRDDPVSVALRGPHRLLTPLTCENKT